MEHAWRRNRTLVLAFQPGVSLIEILICMTLVAFAMMPILSNMNSASRNSTFTFLQSSRSMLLGSILDEMDIENPVFASSNPGYDMGNTPDASQYVESGRGLQYLRRVDTDSARSSAMRRRVYLYLYKNAGDAGSDPMYQTVEDLCADALFFDVGQTSTSAPSVDSHSQLWLSNLQAADNTLLRPGYISGYDGIAIDTGVTSLNINNALDDEIFQTVREGTDLRYAFQVDPGAYIVRLYFSEAVGTVTGTAPNRRSADISIGDAADFTTLPTLLANYSPRVSTGASRAAEVLAFDVNVPADSPTRRINIRVKSAAAGTDLPPRVSAISLHRL